MTCWPEQNWCRKTSKESKNASKKASKKASNDSKENYCRGKCLCCSDVRQFSTPSAAWTPSRKDAKVSYYNIAEDRIKALFP